MFTKKSDTSQDHRYKSFYAKRRTEVGKKPIERLSELMDKVDICRLIRINWLLSPMINSRSTKLRLFNFNYKQVRKLIEGLEDPVKKAICLYLADDLFECMQIC